MGGAALFSALLQQDCSEGSENNSPRNSKSNSAEGSSEIAQGYQRLNDLATERGFIIQDVPADGDCLFYAISVQLENVGIQQTESRDLRSAVARYMEQNPMITNELHYRNFISSAVGDDDSNFMNVDTEAPTEEDNLISTIEDKDTRAELLWTRYLKRLKQGAWGDHLTVQALANMLNVKIRQISLWQRRLSYEKTTSHYSTEILQPKNSGC